MSEQPVSSAARAAARPMSPFMLWRWHVTMFTSILHRVTGAALYGGALLLVGWAFALAAGRTPYATYMGLLGSPLGKLVLVGLTLCLFYHLANGVRHLVWDFGKGFEPKTASGTAWLVLAVAVVATAAVWGDVVFGAGA
jgi:succinate dehydrogenase / fumarate reductase cytochrome b subunit